MLHWYRLVGAVALAVCAIPAVACPPTPGPPPGEMPALARQAREGAASHFENSTNVVYGVVSNSAGDGEIARFRIIHVYKGELQPGTSIEVRSVDSRRLHPPSCPVFSNRPALVQRGAYGVLAFSGEQPVLEFLHPCTLDYWFRNNWIIRQTSRSGFDQAGHRIYCHIYDDPDAGGE